MEKISIPKTLEKKLVKLAPTWYDKLRLVCWNRNELPPIDADKLASSYSCCFIGEMHGFSESYMRICETNADRCESCHRFAKDILYTTNGHSTNKEVVTFLKEVVKHFEEKHPTFFNIPVAHRHDIVTM